MSQWAMFHEEGGCDLVDVWELTDLITDLKSWNAFAHMIASGKPADMTFAMDNRPPERVRVIRASRRTLQSSFHHPYG